MTTGAGQPISTGLDSLGDALVEHGWVIALGELAPGAAHEINNPLFAILGLAGFLLEEAEPGTRTHERLELIQQSALEIRDTLQALLAFARPSPGEPGPVLLEGVARDTVGSVRRLTLIKDVEIVEEYGGQVPPAKGSDSQLRQALLGLVLAALRSAEGGSSIHVGVAEDLGNVVLSVGAAELHADGLGLELARSIARAHEGELVVRDGARAAFELRLPAWEDRP